MLPISSSKETQPTIIHPYAQTTTTTFYCHYKNNCILTMYVRHHRKLALDRSTDKQWGGLMAKNLQEK